MGKHARRTALHALLALIGLVACSKVTHPVEDKNTNWLKLCDGDPACGEGLQCLCGVCTLACDETVDCEQAAPGASCHAVTDAALEPSCQAYSTGGAEAVCTAACTTDGECQASVGPDARCEAGACVRTTRVSTGEPDASVSPGVATFEAFIAGHGDCQSVDDCTLIMPGCPLGCFAAVDTASVAEAEELAREARMDGPSCVYRCALAPALTCVESRCVAETTAPPAGGWTKLAEPPLSGRIEALVAVAGDTIVVAGGSDWLCPPGADCVLSDTPPHADGAAYDLSAARWTAISDAPVGFSGARKAVAGDDIYALSQCDAGPICPAGHALLRYRIGSDAWDMLPGPPEAAHYTLATTSEDVVAYLASDEGGIAPDYRFLTGEERWEALPDDPLPPAYDRTIVEYDGSLMLFATPIASTANDTKLAAAYDPATGAWRELAESGTLGYQVWRAGSLFYLNPHFRNAEGGIYDPSTDTWGPWPAPPYHDLAGVIGSDTATYAYSSGWVFDARTAGWLEIAPRPDAAEVYGEGIAATPDGGMVVFGGQTWTDGDGRLLNDTWLWTPPPVTSRQ